MTAKQEEKYRVTIEQIGKKIQQIHKCSDRELHVLQRIHLQAEINQNYGLQAIALVTIGVAHQIRGDYDQIICCIETIKQLYPRINRTDDQCKVCLCLGIRFRDRGEISKALQYLYEGKAQGEKGDELSMVGKIIAAIAGILSIVGNYNDALRYAFQALHIGNEKKDFELSISMTGTIGFIYKQLRDYRKSIEYSKRTINLAKKHTYTLQLSFAYYNTGAAYMDMGGVDTAEYYYKKALKTFRNIGVESHQDLVLIGIGTIYLAKNMIESGMKYLLLGYNIAKKNSREQYVVVALINIGKGLYQQGKYTEAVKAYQHVLDTIKDEKYPSERSEIHRSLSEAFTKMEEYKEAFFHRKRAEELEEELRGLALLQSARATEVAETLYRLEKEQKELEERARKAEEDVKHKEEQLQEVTASLQQSMKTLKEVEEVVKPFLEQEDTTTKELANSIYKSLSKTIKAQRSQKPEKYFDKSYQEYIRRLHKACEALTPMEIKVCILIKLNYSNKQIGEVMNVSELTVKTHRARIRKKMSLIPQENLLSVLLRI